MLIESVVKVLVIRASSFADAYTWTQVIPIVATAIAIGITVALALRVKREGERQAWLHAQADSARTGAAD